jgi:hypothetical protein
MIINFYLYGGLNNGDGVVFQVEENVDMSNAVMLGAGLGNVLAKEAGEFESLLVEKNKVRSKWFDLLLLRSSVDQSWIVSRGDGRKICLAFD